MDIVVWTDDDGVDAETIAQCLPYGVRSVRVFFRPSGEELGRYISSDDD